MSLRTRIVAWFVLLSALLVLGYSFTTARQVDHARTEALDGSLASLAETIAGLVEVEVEYDDGELEYEIELDDEHLVRQRFAPDRTPRRVFAIRTAEGETIAASPGVDPDALAAAVPGATSGHPVTGAAALADGTPVRLLARAFTARAEYRRRGQPREQHTVVVVVGQDLRPLQEAAAQQANVMVWLIPATLLVSVLAGWFLSSRIVGPLRAMSAAAEQIEGSDLSRRVPVPQSRDEVASLAETLNRAFGRLQNAFERQARFTADAAHELRTPVAVIRTHAEVALRQPRDGTEDAATLRDVVAASERMQETLDGLLLLARADSNRLVHEMHPLSLRATADAVVAELAAEAEAAGHSLEVDTDGPAEVLGHGESLQILLRNLVGNAIRHSGRPGAIRVTVRGRDDSVQLAVRDEGVGIPADSQPQLFDRFYRVDPSRQRDGRGGSGLGLAIVRTIANLHGATVAVDSEPDRGTTITVTFPRGPRPTATA